jgi:Transmembrane domain of unknown function (DUF3566)
MARTDADIDAYDEPFDPPRTTSSGNGAWTFAFKDRVQARRQRQPKSTKLKPSYERHYRQTIRRVDLWSVLKISICFYVMALVVVLFAGVVLWWIASAFGVISDIENFVGELVNSTDFKFLSWNVLRASALVGLVIVCVMVIWTVVGAAFYNLFSQIFGGVEVTVVEEESVARK